MVKPQSIGISDIRDTNRRIVLRTIWRLQPVSRADVARLTRISKSSISSIVAGLVAEGLIKEEAAETTQIGRTPIYLRLNAAKHHFFAIDVRVTGVIVAIYDLAGTRVAEDRIATPPMSASPERLLEAAADKLIDLCKKKRISQRSIKALGMAVPGQADREAGLVLNSSSIGWKNVDAQAILLARLNRTMATSIDNSANHAIRAEVWHGHSVHENITGVYVDINESVESAIIIDGKILSARVYGMGSFGRMHIAADDGATWESKVSVQSIIERFSREHKPRTVAARSATGKNRASRNATLRGTDIRTQLLEIKEAYLKGDRLTVELIQETAHWLAMGISNIFVSLGFPHVIIGGYIRSIWDLVQEQVFRECDSLTEHDFPGAREIRLSSLTELETLEGAALGAIGTVIPLDLLSQLTTEQKEIIESRVL